MKKIILIFCTALLFGCSPAPYMKVGDTWWPPNAGYSDFVIGQNQYMVSYTGGLFNQPPMVMQYAFQRAKDLCKEKGFNDFVESNATSTALVSGDGKNTSTQTVYSMKIECKNK